MHPRASPESRALRDHAERCRTFLAPTARWQPPCCPHVRPATPTISSASGYVDVAGVHAPATLAQSNRVGDRGVPDRCRPTASVQGTGCSASSTDERGDGSMLRMVRTSVTRLTWVFDDLLALCLIIVTFTMVNAERIPGGVDEFLAVRLTVRNVALGLAFIVLWHASFAACGLYRTRPRETLAGTWIRIVVACTAAATALLPFTAASRSGAFNPYVVAYFWLAAVSVEIVVRTAISFGARYAEHHAREIKHAVIVGSGPRALRLHEDLLRRNLNDYVVVGFIDSRDPAAMPPIIRERLLGTLDQFEHLVS